jgi:hypothetical protein
MTVMSGRMQRSNVALERGGLGRTDRLLLDCAFEDLSPHRHGSITMRSERVTAVDGGERPSEGITITVTLSEAREIRRWGLQCCRRQAVSLGTTQA